MSLAETQQIMALLTEISQILDGINVKTTKINNELPRTEKSLASFRMLERVALRYLVLARQMGLPEEFDRALKMVSKLIVLINMLQMSMNMLTRGPLGVAMAIPSILMVYQSAGSLMEGY